MSQSQPPRSRVFTLVWQYCYEMSAYSTLIGPKLSTILTIVVATLAWYTLNTLCGVMSKRGLENYTKIDSAPVLIFTTHELNISIIFATVLVVLRGMLPNGEGLSSVFSSAKLLRARVVGTAIFNLIGMLITNKAYSVSSVSFVQLSKALEPIITWMLQLMLLPKTSPVNWRSNLGMLFTVVGILLTMQFDYNFSPRQIAWVLFASAVYPCRNILIKLQQTHERQSDHGHGHAEKQATLDNGLDMILGLLIVGDAFLVFGLSLVSLGGHKLVPFGGVRAPLVGRMSSLLTDKQTTFMTVPLIAASISFVGYQACSIFVLRKTSAVSHSLLNAVKRLVSVSLLLLLEEKGVSLSAIIGVILTSCGTVVFNHGISRVDG